MSHAARQTIVPATSSMSDHSELQRRILTQFLATAKRQRYASAPVVASLRIERDCRSERVSTLLEPVSLTP